MQQYNVIATTTVCPRQQQEQHKTKIQTTIQQCVGLLPNNVETILRFTRLKHVVLVATTAAVPVQ